MGVKRGGLAALYMLPILFLGGFYLYPLVSLLRVSFGVPDALQAVAALNSPGVWRLLWFTAWQALLSTALTVLVGVPLAALLGRFTFPGRRLLSALLTVPFVMPAVVVAPAFLALVGNEGVVTGWLQARWQLPRFEQTLGLILWVHVFYNVAIVIRTVGGLWSTLPASLAEAAAMLGARPGQVLWTVTLPLLAPGVLAASLLVFLFCFTSFGVILILGGPRYATLEVEIYRQTVHYFNLPLAALLSLVQLCFTVSVMVFYTRLQARLSRSLRRQRVRLRPPAGRWEWLAVVAALLATLVGVFAPLLALAVRSFTLGDQGGTWVYYEALGQNLRQSAFFVPPVVAIRNSLLYALLTLAISLPLGVIAASMLARPRARWAAVLEPLLLLPLGTSAVTLGFGYIVAMGPLRAWPWLAPIAHSLIALPFVVRALLPALRALDQRLREAAATLGASPWRRWWTVDAPLLARALLVSAAFAFAISLGEFGATLLIARPDWPTMPMVIYQAFSRPGLLNYGQGLAMSTLLMGVTAASALLIERLRLPGEEEF